MRRTLLIGLIALAGPTVSIAAQQPDFGQTNRQADPAKAVVGAPAASLDGAVVRDRDGKTLGVVDGVLTSADGRTRQVLVRTGEGLRSLPYDSLMPVKDGLLAELTRGEFELLPIATR